MPFVDDTPTNPQSNPPPVTPTGDDDLYAPFQGANGQGKAIAGAPLDVGPTTWSDIPKAIAAGAHETAADVAGSVAAIAPQSRTGIQAQQFATQQEQAQQETEQGMSPAAQRPGFLSHPLVSAAEAAPGIAAIAVPAAIGSAVAGPVGATLLTSTLMGAQQLGGAQNRAVDQGIELTPAEKLEQFGIGAASGIVPEIGIPSKIAVSPLVRTVLRGGVDAAGFGAGAAGGEAVSETGEINAGKRTGYDPSAIGGAFLTGAEQGGGFALTHVFHGKTRLPEGGQSAEPTRSDTQYPKAETPPVAKGDVATPPENKGPPPPPPKVDPAQAAALNPQPVTPRVNEPPIAPVEQPQVVQPEAPPSETAPVDQGQANTTEPVPPPTERAETQPAPVPAPPREDVTAVQPESAATLQEQHAALLDPNDPREAMIYPKGAQVFDLPDKSFGQVKLPDGRIVQFDKEGNSGFTSQKIRQYAKDDRLNEALQLGPVSKDEALSRVAAGETPVAVTERTPQGTEVKAAAGTEATAPAQQAALELTKAPENTTAVERPEGVVAARQAEIAQEQAVQPKVVEDYPQGKAPVTPTGRVLKAQDAAAVRARDQAIFEDRQQALRVQDELKRKEAARQAAIAKEAGIKERSHAGAEAVEKVSSDNAAAQRISDAHKAPVATDNVRRPVEIYNRAKAIADAARAAKLDVPKAFPEGHPYNPAMLKIREAMDLTAKKVPKWDAYARYLDREHLIDNNRGEEAFAARRSEGALGLGSPEGAEGVRAKGGAVDEEGKAEARPEAVHEETPIEHMAGGGEEEAHEERPPDALAAARAEREEKIAKARAESEAMRQEALQRAEEGAKEREQLIEARRKEALETNPYLKPGNPTYDNPPLTRAEQEALEKNFWSAPPKAAVGFKTTKPFEGMRPKVEGKIKLRKQAIADWVRENFDRVSEGKPGAMMAFDEDGNPHEVSPFRTAKIADIINEHFDLKHYSADLRPMMERLKDAVVHIAGDTTAHVISHEDMVKLVGSAHGYYDSDADHIMLNRDYALHDTPLHEAFHAATAKAIEKNPELKDLMERLRAEVRGSDEVRYLDRQSAGDVKYALSDPEEFITGMMTNPAVQKLLKGLKISDELARDIGIPKWRKMTMWEGAMSVIRRALGLGPRDTSAIEATMALSEKAMWADRRGAGMAMEASARLGRATEAEQGKPVSLSRLKFQRMEPPERDQEAFLKSPVEHLATIKGINKDIATQYVKDKAGNAGVTLLGKTARFLSGTQLSDLHGKIFTDAKGNIIEAINRARDKVSHVYNEARRGDRDTINRGYLLDQKYKTRMGDYADLVNMSARYNIHADRDAPKVPKKPENAPRKNWQANANWQKARELYASLPAELQDRYRAEKKFYQDKQKELANTVINKVLPVLDLPKDMEERLRNNDLTDDDWEKLHDMKADTVVRNAQRLINKTDVYFPGTRDGNFVVTGRYEMPDGGSATDFAGDQLPDNKREFDTEKEAHDYVTGTHMPATVRETTYWTNPQGKTERVPAGEAASTGTITKKYEVSLERQHTEMHDTHSEALKARAEMEKAGVKELSSVLDKRNERAWASIGSGEQNAFERRIMNRDDITGAEKQHLVELTRQMALGKQNGMAPHLLQSRKVAGANMRTAEGLDAYSRAINQHMARNSHSVELAQAMGRMDEHENATRGDTDATTRSIIGNEMRNRVYDQSAGINAKVSPLMHRLMTMSFVNFLVRPSHIFLSQVHPYVYSVPMMAARHGYWGALRAQKQAMSDLGGNLANLGRGFMAGVDVAKSLREKDTEKAVQLAHGADPIHEMINRLKDKGERNALMQMYETQHLHSAYDQSMFTGGGIDRTNVMMQQFTNAMEANNRLSTALAAYRLEKARTGDAAHSLAYAQRVIEETHGIYSAGNAAPIFKNPLLRATLQFHQQPMNLAFMLYRNAYKAFKGDTEARWTLGYQLGTAALLGGMGGMPLDLPKLAGLGTQIAGGPSPSDWDDKMRRELVDTLGQTAANAIMEGLPGLMGPLGPSLGHRMGFDAGLLNGEPASGKTNDVMSWAAKQVAGAPGDMLLSWRDALMALEQGDFQKASENALPGSLKDFAKAYRLGTSGVQAGGKTIRPASYGDALLQTLGFSGVERERQTEGHYKLQEAIRNQPKTVAEQLKAKQAAKRAAAYPMGIKPTAKNAPLIREYQRAYE